MPVSKSASGPQGVSVASGHGGSQVRVLQVSVAGRPLARSTDPWAALVGRGDREGWSVFKIPSGPGSFIPQVFPESLLCARH